MLSLSSHMTRVPAPSQVKPLDWGISLARAHWKSIAFLSVLAGMMEIVLTLIAYGAELEQQQEVLRQIVLFLVTTWSFVAVSMFSVEKAKGEKVSLVAVSLRALQFLPKVFFSSLIFLFLVASAVRFGLLWLIVVFFIWAPFFCVIETYAEREAEDDKGGEDENDDGLSSQNLVPRSLFFNKSALELGYSRSMQTCISHFKSSLQAAVLLACFILIPAAFFLVVESVADNFLVESVKMLSTSFLYCFSVSFCTGALLRLVPTVSLPEIGLSKESFDSLEFPHGNVTLQDNGRLFAALIFSIFVALAVVAQQGQSRFMFPEGGVAEIQSAAVGESYFTLKVKLSNLDNHFLFFDKDKLRVAVTSINEDPEGKPQKSFVVLTDPRIVFFTEDGIRLSDSIMYPPRDTFVIHLYFELAKAVAPQGAFKLYYSFSGGVEDQQLVVEGPYGD